MLLTIPFPVWLTLIWISWFSFLGLTACGSIKHHAAQWVWITVLQSTAGCSECNWKSFNFSVSSVGIQVSAVQPNHLAWRKFFGLPRFRAIVLCKSIPRQCGDVQEVVVNSSERLSVRDSLNYENMPRKYNSLLEFKLYKYRKNRFLLHNILSSVNKQSGQRRSRTRSSYIFCLPTLYSNKPF